MRLRPSLVVVHLLMPRRAAKGAVDFFEDRVAGWYNKIHKYASYGLRSEATGYECVQTARMGIVLHLHSSVLEWCLHRGEQTARGDQVRCHVVYEALPAPSSRVSAVRCAPACAKAWSTPAVYDGVRTHARAACEQ